MVTKLLKSVSLLLLSSLVWACANLPESSSRSVESPEVTMTPSPLNTAAPLLTPEVTGQSPDQLQDLNGTLTEPDREKSGSPKLTATLNKLVADWPAGPGVAEAVGQGVEIDKERVRVMISMLNEASADLARIAITDMGGEVVTYSGNLIEAWLPVAVLNQAVELPGVGQIREPEQPATF